MKAIRNLTILFFVLGLAGYAQANWVTVGNDMYADIPGNVGIGTMAPDKKLTVEGNIEANVSLFATITSGMPQVSIPGRGGTVSGHFTRQELRSIVVPFPDESIDGPIFYVRKARESYGFLGGSLTEGGLLPLTNVTYGIGTYGEVSTGKGMGVYGHAIDANDILNYGGYFLADGQRGIGIYAKGGPNGKAAEFDGKLEVYGAAVKTGGGSWESFSDIRLKTLDGGYKRGLSEVSKLSPIRYSYAKDNKLNLPSEGKHIGLVAQEVQSVIPEAVKQSESGYLTVDNDPIIWAVVNAVKELNAQNEELRSENAELMKRLDALESMMDKQNSTENGIK